MVCKSLTTFPSPPPSLPLRTPACRWTAMGTSQYPLPMGAWRFGRASVPPNSRRTDGTCTFEVRMRFPSLASPALSPPSLALDQRHPPLERSSSNYSGRQGRISIPIHPFPQISRCKHPDRKFALLLLSSSSQCSHPPPRLVNGRWSVVDDRWSMIGGRWSMVSGR